MSIRLIVLGTFVAWTCVLVGEARAQECGQICEIEYWTGKDPDSDSLLKVIHAMPNVDARHEYGWTVLAVAASFANEQAVKILLERGADANIPDHWGSTPIFAAVKGGSLGVVKMLIAAGADPTHEDKNGQTPYIFALINDQTEIADYFEKIAEEAVSEGKSDNPETSQSRNILTTDDFQEAFGGISTEMSRILWDKNNEGRYSEFTGVVNDIDAPGFLSSGYRVILDTVDVTGYCNVKEADLKIIVNLNAGDTFTCRGTYKSYVFILGSGGVSFDILPNKY